MIGGRAPTQAQLAAAQVRAPKPKILNYLLRSSPADGVERVPSSELLGDADEARRFSLSNPLAA